MFTGYTPETVDFLWGIRLNNNREWFMENKQRYIDTLYQPTKALGARRATEGQPYLPRCPNAPPPAL